GEKTAIKLLSEYGSVENLYAHIDEISGPKTRQNLIDARDQVERNRRLMTIVRDLDLKLNPEACRLEDYDQTAVIRLFNELEFRSLIRELPGAGEIAAPAGDGRGQMVLLAEEGSELPPPTTPGGVDYLCIESPEDLDQLVEKLRHAPRLSFDVETTSTDAMSAKL